MPKIAQKKKRKNKIAYKNKKTITVYNLQFRTYSKAAWKDTEQIEIGTEAEAQGILQEYRQRYNSAGWDFRIQPVTKTIYRK